ncbi:cell division membrane protein-like protein [Paenibacillus sp. FSL R7-277]|uniref:FtsW/RodA/SpoVE family cell cycle protein n=1 Tax=Paenibacillus sp. FSL R7-277 TaxID=1227352 RepID=UPI0003E247F2|nr:FtsW/RodA/SpoVE family cell cycle protein [Paenibacillus sp. FSL R7-277]ETT63123.1 cell division membrane protein-like protein [Paenibacillus sp. FSL R7-277]
MEPNQKVLNRYLNKVCAEVKAKGMHDEIREELSGHFADLMTERQQQGASEEEAQQYAIAQLGDPQAIGRDLHQIHKPRIPWGLLAGVIMLSVVSLLGMAAVEAGFGDYYKFPDALMLRQGMFIVLGIAVMAIMYFINFKQLQRASGWIYGGALLLIAVGMWFNPNMVNGTRRYAFILGFPFDLIGYSPYLFIVGLAGLLKRPGVQNASGSRIRNWKEVGLLLLPAAIYLVIPSFAELVVYLAVALPLYVWITQRWGRAVVVAASCVSGLALYVWSETYLRDRFNRYLFINDAENGVGFLNRMIHSTLTSAGWGGQGIVELAEDKRLPYPYTDFFPVYLVQSFGWAGGLLLLVLVCWFVLRMLYSARTVSDTYGRALILALALMLSIRLIYGLTILTGRMPLISIPFPFLSYGQHVFIEFAALGLLMGVYRRKDMLPAGQAPSSL